jgi:hypothetical protein
MKIEISEVFVNRNDAITLERKPSAVGLAAIEPRTAPVPPNIKCYRFPLISALLQFIPVIATETKTCNSNAQVTSCHLLSPPVTKQKKIPYCSTVDRKTAPDTCGHLRTPADISGHLRTPLDTKKRILFFR